MENKRITWVDALNIVACAGVLLLHCTNSQIHGFSGEPSVEWYIGLFTHSFFSWPVNVFFMLSGFTLIRKSLIDKCQSGGVKGFYLKRLNRLGPALLLWNILYMTLNIVHNISHGEQIDGILTMIKKFVLFEYNGFMWFFVPLLLIYLALPFLSYFVLYADRKVLRSFLIIGLAMSFIPPLETSFTTRESLPNIYLLGSRFMYYVFLGYYIGHYNFSKMMKKRIYVAGIISVLLMFAGTYMLTIYKHEYYKYFITYTNIPCTISAMAVFLYFKSVDWGKVLNKLHLHSELLAKWSSLSLGIYLIQAVWFNVLMRLHIDLPMLINFVLMYILCFSSVWLMKKIPLTRQLVP